MADLRSPAAPTHERRHLRLCGQYDLCGNLLFDTASRPRPVGVGFFIEPAFLGLAVDHRRRRNHAAAGIFQRQGIRGADLAHQHRGGADLGRFRHQLFLDPRDPQREIPLCRDLVLHRNDHHCGDALYRQPPPVADQPHSRLPDLRWCAGCARPMVVWAQRGRVLPHHAGARHHVLLLTEGRRASGLQLPAFGDSLLVACLHLHLGRAAPFAEHRTSRMAAIPGHDFQPHALGAVLGRHAQWAAHSARGLGQTPHRPGAEVFRGGRYFLWHGHIRGAASGDPLGERRLALYRLDDRSCAFGNAWLEQLHGCRNVLLARSAPLEHQALLGPSS